MYLVSWGTKQGTHINFFRGDFCVKKGVPNGLFSATKSLVYCFFLPLIFTEETFEFTERSRFISFSGVLVVRVPRPTSLAITHRWRLHRSESQALRIARYINARRRFASEANIAGFSQELLSGECLTPPVANPGVAERAPWRPTKRGVAGVSSLLEMPTDSCHFPCTSNTLVRTQYSVARKALSATGR